MASYAFTLLAAASAALAATPVGFTPAAQNQLFLEFGQSLVINGQLVQRDSVLTQPTNIGLLGRPQGTSFAVMMVDLDIPTNNPPQTNTLLHWMQTGLTPATQAVRAGNQNVLMLENRTQTAPLAPYIAPNPPARVPLSHRYTLVLVDTTGLQAQGQNILATAAQNRQGFNVDQVLSSAGLTGRVIAGNFFNVSNTGTAQDDGSGTFTGGTPTDGSNNGNNGFGDPTALFPGSPSETFLTAGVGRAAPAAAAAVVAVCALVLGL